MSFFENLAGNFVELSCEIVEIVSCLLVEIISAYICVYVHDTCTQRGGLVVNKVGWES